jgi:hypothetical protein
MGRPNVFAEQDSDAVTVGATPAAATEAKVSKSAKPAKAEAEMFRTSLYLSRAVHDVLREIAFHERKKVHDLFMEGLDHVLKKRRHPTAGEIMSSAKAS